MELILISDILLMAFAIIALLIASITDIKKREVADWLSFSLLATTLVIRFFVALLQGNWSYFLYALATGAIVFVIVILLYYGRVLGGGDAKLLVAIACALATMPSFLHFNYTLFFDFGFSIKNFMFDFFINSLFIGFFYSLIFSIVLASRSKDFLKNFNEMNRKNKVLKIILLVIGFLLLILSFKLNVLLILAIFAIILPYLYIFVKSVEASSLIKLKPWSKLTEGDWLIQEVKIGRRILKPSADGLTKQDILAIKKANKKVLVRDGLPFIPVFLLALIACLLTGNLLLRLLELLI